MKTLDKPQVKFLSLNDWNFVGGEMKAVVVIFIYILFIYLFIYGGGDSRVVSVSDFKARGTGFESRWGQRSLVLELVNIYHVLSCSFVEIIRLYVVSVCIN